MEELSRLQKKILKKLKTQTQYETQIELNLTAIQFRKNLSYLREQGLYKPTRKYRAYNAMIEQHYDVPDINLNKALNVKLDENQKIYLDQNRNKPRTILAKELGISKMALLFILDNEMDKK